MLRDRYDQPLSIASIGARDAYVDGVDRLLAAQPDAERAFERAIAEAPAFALAHIGLARALALRGNAADARAAAQRARGAVSGITAREQRHVHAIALAIEGKPSESLSATHAHLDDFPRDAMVLAPATGVFGLVGFSGRRDREQVLYEWLQHLAPNYGEDWWFLGVHGFAAVESGRVDEARQLVARSLALNPQSGNAAHFQLHVHYETNEDAEALALVESWLQSYPRAALMHVHLAWHGALSALALGAGERAQSIYADAVHPGASWGPPLIAFTDAASFLWRAALAGDASSAERWRDVHTYGARVLPNVGIAFADIHRMLAATMAGDTVEADRLITALEQALAAGRLAAGEVGPQLARAFAAAARGDWSDAIDPLERARSDAVRIGGSRAQRDIVEETLLHAYLRSDRADHAADLLRQKRERRRVLTHVTTTRSRTESSHP